MPPVTYDTSVFKSYKPEEFPSGFLFSAVVIQELIASANDDSEMNRWAAAHRAYEKEDRLIVPNAADWLLAGLAGIFHTKKKTAPANWRPGAVEAGGGGREAGP